MNSKLISAIVSYGEEYRDKLFNDYNPEVISKDSWAALKFFFGRACFQGRRDDVSELVYKAVIETLVSYFGDSGVEPLNQQSRETLEGELKTKIGKGKVGKGRDVDMVLSALDFASKLQHFNIVQYSVELIRSGKIAEHYNELQHSKSESGIIQVGSKIAAFYLRDTGCLYSLEEKVSSEFAFCLQPVDVWVRKLARRTGIVDEKASDAEIQRAIVTTCEEHGASSLLFNQGAWYLGYRAFDIVLELLDAGH